MAVPVGCWLLAIDNSREHKRYFNSTSTKRKTPSQKNYFWVFLVSVLLSESVKRVSASPMRDLQKKLKGLYVTILRGGAVKSGEIKIYL